jgi:hypothetical protein
LDIGAGQAEKNPVESFHPSTTYCPVDAIDVSDCPYARAPPGLTSSLRLAASTLAENGPASVLPVDFVNWGGGAGLAPKQYI